MTHEGDAEALNLTRRRLLLAGGKYVAPAILVTLALDSTAYAQASCGPRSCNPALTSCGPTRNCRPGRPPGG